MPNYDQAAEDLVPIFIPSHPNKAKSPRERLAGPVAVDQILYWSQSAMKLYKGCESRGFERIDHLKHIQCIVQAQTADSQSTIPSEVVEQPRTIGPETTKPFKKCIITPNTKKAIGETSRIRQRPNAASRPGEEGFPLQGRIPEPPEE
jgi:hypothetical protein